MKRLLLPVTLVFLSACATTAEKPPGIVAIEDFIAVSELPEVRHIRTDRRHSYEELGNNRYLLLKSRRKMYLVELRRNCWELRDNFNIKRDKRVDDSTFYPGVDTIRGCPTGRAFLLDEGQIEEIRNLGDAPTGG